MNKDEIVLWEALSSLETYLRSGIAAQIQT